MTKEAAAERFHKAIAAKDNKQLIDVVTDYENAQLQEIAAVYVQKYGKALPEAIKDAALGEFATLLIDLIIPRDNFAARTIQNAISGLGTDEKAIIDVVITSDNIGKLKSEYYEIFQADLANKIASDLSGHFKKAVAAILARKPLDQLNKINDPDAQAEALYKKGEGVWGTDDDYFVDFFTQNSWGSLSLVDGSYKAKYGHSLEVAIKKETSGAYQDVLIALVLPLYQYWARRIHHAVSGLGTNDTLLRRAFALNTRERLLDIADAYSDEYPGKSLRKDVADDTSGFYRDLFLAVLDKKDWHREKKGQF